MRKRNCRVEIYFTKDELESLKIEILYRGEHGPSRAKCPNCGEEVVFPPIAFRLYTA